jgi:OOP family OmpA-OmpF porin
VRNKLFYILALSVAALGLQACAATTNSAENDGIALTQLTALNNGSVQIFGLDGPANVPATTISGTSASTGVSSPVALIADPSIQVFSLEETVVASNAAMPSIMPPSVDASYPTPFANSAVNTIIVDSGIIATPLDAVSIAPVTNDFQDPYQSVSVALSSNSVQEKTTSIYFPHGSAKLDASKKKVIEEVAKTQLETNPTSLIEVEGHASTRAQVSDPVERRILNLKMSMDRAFQVSSQLIRDGVPATAIKTTIYGDTHPVAAQNGLSEEASNRRVDILTGQ